MWVAFAFQKPSRGTGAKKSPLAGWLGKKSNANPEYDLPEMDVAAGLTRALRETNGKKDEPDVCHLDENPVREALTAIEAALYAIDDVRDILEQACDVVVSAKDAPDAGGRALLAESYDELRLSINRSVKAADNSAAALVGKEARHMDVNLGGKTHYSISAVRLDAGERGLNLTPPREAFEDDEEINLTLDELDKALGRADRAAANYCRDAQYLIARMKGELEG